MDKLFGFFLKDGLHLFSGAALFAAAITLFAGPGPLPVLGLLWVLAPGLLLAAAVRDVEQSYWMHRAAVVPAQVEQVRRLPVKLHTSSSHLADEDVLYPYQILFAYQYEGQSYRGRSEWIWFKPCFPKGTQIQVKVDPKRPKHSFFSL